MKNTKRKQVTEDDDIPFEMSFRLRYKRGQRMKISNVKVAQPNKKSKSSAWRSKT